MVTGQQRRSLEYFKNKIVSFLVGPINRNFSEEQALDYFVGKITQVDESGIWFEHVQTKCLNFIFYEKIISIAEEKFVPDEKEETKDVIEEPITNSVPQNVEDLKNLLS